MNDQLFMYVYLAFAGLFMGSFFNVLADRLSMGKTILGRSMCDSCGHMLEWKDLIPIVSFTLLKGKCRYCKASFSIQYPLSELFTAAVFVLTYYLSLHTYNQEALHIVHLLIASVFVVMLLSDLRYQILPDEMQIVLLFGALVRLFIMYQPTFSWNELSPYLLGSIVVMVPLLLVFLFSKGRGMGFGDVKFAVGMGLLLGMWSGLIAMYIAFLLGGVIGAAILLLNRGTMKSKIAFGPFLLIGTYLMLFFESEVILLFARLYSF